MKKAFRNNQHNELNFSRPVIKRFLEFKYNVDGKLV